MTVIVAYWRPQNPHTQKECTIPDVTWLKLWDFIRKYITRRCYNEITASQSKKKKRPFCLRKPLNLIKCCILRSVFYGTQVLSISESFLQWMTTLQYVVLFKNPISAEEILKCITQVIFARFNHPAHYNIIITINHDNNYFQIENYSSGWTSFQQLHPNKTT